MLKVLSVFGTRPEAIKMAPVVAELERHPDHIASRVCVTAQHREMLDQVLDVFGIAPDIDLDVMTDDQSPSQVTARVLTGLERVLAEERPNLVLVHGDTTTTAAAALASFYRKIPVGHVEAGLRTHDRYYPFPEEVMRVLADALSTYHFAPTATAKENLLREGADARSITVTGNTVIDALLSIARGAGPRDDSVPSDGRLILVTAHRRENFGEPLADICRALRETADAFPDVRVAYPVHLNPNVRKTAHAILGGHERIHLLEPLAYAGFVRLLMDACLVVTDSGGLQEEAPALGKPVLVLRAETERPEAVLAGTVKLVGTRKDDIVREIRTLLTDPAAYRAMAEAANPYGDGHASGRIVGTIMCEFGVGNGAKRPEEFVPPASKRAS
jgi:UDP-N-acetylglucosamine 2-epimerase (non-hydrolysing)